MKVSRERLIEELAHYIVEVRELREENMSLRKELESFSEERKVIETRESEEEELERKLSLSVYDDSLNFSVRTVNAFQKQGIETVRDIVNKTQAELMKPKNFGRRSIGEVKSRLSLMGLELSTAM